MSINSLHELKDEIVELRHALHAHPELSGEEHATRRRIRDFLYNAGIDNITETPSGALIVDVLAKAKNTNRLITIGIRGDMDALPIDEERSDLPYASRVEGVMHACGHDTHSAIAAGAAVYFNNKKNLNGNIRIIFQPSEESEPLGGRDVVSEGWVDDMDAMIGVHAFPFIPSGTVGVVHDYVTAAADSFSLTFQGKSAHGAFPYQGTDTIFIASAFIQLLQGIISRQTASDESAVISIGMISGGIAENIICDHTELRGTIRTRSPETRAEIQRKVVQLAEGVAKIHGAESHFILHEGEPSIQNDEHLVSTFIKTAEEQLGKDKLHLLKPLMGSDDFGFYSQKCRSLYFFYGCYNPDLGNIHPLHSPKFGIADEDMLSGFRLTISTAEEILKELSEAPES
ncbi:amidohydrolase [Franzmannia pantelleriensis]|uniref:Amidohydrolase n=1 Tax=Franzmannia pantelleriensis TaxID=48727 RepID=A0A1G9N2S5_9GAMM|nr:M20 family metallopeptidase [Halomonas pantelleriensis]SDL80427.1 amidohydrolase [Halomonas pantelleriensis]